MTIIRPVYTALSTRLLASSLWLRVCLTACLISLSPLATAVDSILIVHDSKSELSNEVIHSLSQKLSSEPTQIDLLDISSKSLPENLTLESYITIITLGSQATQITLEKNPRSPLLSLLLSRQSWLSIKSQNNTYPHSVILLDQPVDRQLRMVREIFGNDSSIGALLGPYSSSLKTELTEVSRQQQQKLDIRTIQNDEELIPTLSSLSQNTDVLLAIPDSVVYNKRSIQGILLLTYRNKTPVVGFSQAYTRAGAVASLYSSAEDIAQHAAEIIRNKQTNGEMYYPKYFSISFNQQVARTLGISPPNEKQLIERIRQKEKLRQ